MVCRFSPGRGGGRGREKGRIALDTLIGVRRCVKKNAQTAFELAVGSEPGRPARLVVPLKGDEVRPDEALLSCRLPAPLLRLCMCVCVCAVLRWC